MRRFGFEEEQKHDGYSYVKDEMTEGIYIKNEGPFHEM